MPILTWPDISDLSQLNGREKRSIDKPYDYDYDFCWNEKNAEKYDRLKITPEFRKVDFSLSDVKVIVHVYGHHHNHYIVDQGIEISQSDILHFTIHMYINFKDDLGPPNFYQTSKCTWHLWFSDHRAKIISWTSPMTYSFNLALISLPSRPCITIPC